MIAFLESYSSLFERMFEDITILIHRGHQYVVKDLLWCMQHLLNNIITFQEKISLNDRAPGISINNESTKKIRRHLTSLDLV